MAIWARITGMFIERHEYLIDHFRVSFQGGVAWQCACAEFAARQGCRHVREAAGMREAQSLIARKMLAGGARLRDHGSRSR
jgi:hypothetical protein